MSAQQYWLLGVSDPASNGAVVVVTPNGSFQKGHVAPAIKSMFRQYPMLKLVYVLTAQPDKDAVGAWIQAGDSLVKKLDASLAFLAVQEDSETIPAHWSNLTAQA